MSKLYGVGVGSGDPEQLTLKAVRIITECEVMAVPAEHIEESVAYKIVKAAIPEIDNKEIIGINMPMTKDVSELKKKHNEEADRIIEKLNEGKNVAFITLGDPTIYSTFTYIQDIIESRGFSTQIVSGIASFLASAALINKKLVARDEMLHIIPGTYGIDEAMNLSGTKVIMKAGKNLKELKQKISEKGSDICFIENCGMDNERIIKNIDEIPDEAGYYSMIIVFD